jgi:hypothetical protein
LCGVERCGDLPQICQAFVKPDTKIKFQIVEIAAHLSPRHSFSDSLHDRFSFVQWWRVIELHHVFFRAVVVWEFRELR